LQKTIAKIRVLDILRWYPFHVSFNPGCVCQRAGVPRFVEGQYYWAYDMRVSAPCCDLEAATRPALDTADQMAHDQSMIHRAIALIAVLCFAIFPAITAAHATALAKGAEQDHHVAHLLGGATDHHDCKEGSSCDVGNAGACAAACAALAGHFLPLEGVAPVALILQVHLCPTEVAATGRVPGLAERPPTSRLL
jgi:hypothetical protein